MRLIHQIMLGLIDSLIEHSTRLNLFKELSSMLRFYESTRGLISDQIERLFHRPLISSPLSGIKRKSSQSEESATKLKSNETSAKRVPFQNITNVQQEAAKIAPNLTPMKEISFVNINFESISRISYTCCEKLLKMQFDESQNDEDDNDDDNDDDRTTGDHKIKLALIMSEQLNDYILSVVDKKLKYLEKRDPEKGDLSLYSNEEAFKFLHELWTTISYALNSANSNNISSININLLINYKLTVFNKLNRYLNILLRIWKLMEEKFAKYLSSILGHSDESNVDSCLVSWKFLLKCSKMITFLSKVSSSSLTKASQCIHKLLQLVLNVLSHLRLEPRQYDNLSEWFIVMTRKCLSNDEEHCEVIMKLLIKLNSLSNSPMLSVKNFGLELLMYKQFNSAEYLSYHNIDISQETNILSDTNEAKYQRFLCQEIQQILDAFKTGLRFANDSNKDKFVVILLTQMKFATYAVHYLVSYLNDGKLVQDVITTMVMFYQMLTYLLQHVKIIFSNYFI